MALRLITVAALAALGEVPTVVLLDAQGRIAARLGPGDRGLGEALRALESKSGAS
ncbi:MAG TPA: hypothetical protein VEU54_03150 [Steroidobacteraceae bacterium]|nr:hypothetical protein [Steroidobacteraceae bacterium]